MKIYFGNAKLRVHLQFIADQAFVGMRRKITKFTSVTDAKFI